jgi:hypothetical protein
MMATGEKRVGRRPNADFILRLCAVGVFFDKPPSLLAFVDSKRAFRLAAVGL